MFFSLLAVHGILLLVLRARAFERVSLILQGTVFVAALGLLPLIGRQPVTAWWWPPVWFVDLWASMVRGPGHVRPAVIAMALPVAVSVFAYILSYQRGTSPVWRLHIQLPVFPFPVAPYHNPIIRVVEQN